MNSVRRFVLQVDQKPPTTSQMFKLSKLNRAEQRREWRTLIGDQCRLDLGWQKHRQLYLESKSAVPPFLAPPVRVAVRGVYPNHWHPSWHGLYIAGAWAVEELLELNIIGDESDIRSVMLMPPEVIDTYENAMYEMEVVGKDPGMVPVSKAPKAAAPRKVPGVNRSKVQRAEIKKMNSDIERALDRLLK